MGGALTALLNRWKAGDENAQYELMHELQPLVRELIRLVQARRASDLTPRIDSHGVVNAALKSFFSGARKAEFPVLANTQDVRKILYMLVSRTLSDEIDWHHVEKRSTRIEQPIEKLGVENLQASPQGIADLAGWIEKFEPVLRQVHPMAIKILELWMDGLSNNDIADELGITVRSVQIIRKKMIEAWREFGPE